MTYQLTIEPLGETIPIREGQTVLDACLRNGIFIPYQCNHGLCSTCKITVLEGEVDLGDASPFALMDFERDDKRALACCARPMSDITIEADVDIDPDALYLPVNDVVGTVVGLVDLTHDIKGVTLEVPGDGLPFQAGQYVNLTVPGLDEPRAFSLANAPSKANFPELHVRRVKDGKGTGWVHHDLKVGDKVPLSGPLGRFYVRKSAANPMIFIAGGSGLSSPKAMIEDLLEEGWSGPITLFHGVRQARDLYFDGLFRELDAKHGNFTYVPVLSESDGTDGWTGETGFVHEAAIRRYDGVFKGNKAYLCGPPLMVEASIRALMKGRLFEHDIYTESFLTKADDNAKRSPLFQAI